MGVQEAARLPAPDVPTRLRNARVSSSCALAGRARLSWLSRARRSRRYLEMNKRVYYHQLGISAYE